MKRLFLSTTLLMWGIVCSMINLQLSIINCQSPTAQAASIGTWKNYLSYHNITWVEKGGNTLYVLASNSLYTYNTNDKSLQTYDKINGLSDCHINYIAWNNSTKQLLIAYQNYNIDLLDEKGNITNISDYYSKSMTVDKTIYSIDMSGQYAYISTGFGIIKLNTKDAEITNTYNLGFRVDYSYVEGDYIYAASSTNGLYRGYVKDNLLDKNNWKRVGDYVARSKTVDPELLATVQTLNPGGPKYNLFGFMKFANEQLYTCGMIIDNTIPACIQLLKDDNWTIYQDEGISEKTGVRYEEIVCLDYDPKDINHVFACGRNGLYEFQNGKFVNFFNEDNSPIEPAFPGGKEYNLVTGLKFDAEGNLWILNSQAPTQAIIKFTKDRQWVSLPHSELMKLGTSSLGDLSKMIIDSRGNFWFTNNSWTRKAFYRYNATNDEVTEYTELTNQDGTQLSTIYNISCVVEDKSHNFWVGTNVGPFRLKQDDAYNPVVPTIVEQVKVPRNDGTNLADYLLADVDIRCIAVDGGNRKWFGTNGLGVYLISSDGLSEIHHFTTENSNLLSNIINSIAINDRTGEVFFGTDEGLCSYMSDATATNDEMTKDNVYAYPNPVRPDYNGLITVTGLSYNADVKIVTTNGVLVAEGKSNGGTFTWNGTDLKGQRVASGIYMVQTATQTGESGTVCKIAIVN